MRLPGPTRQRRGNVAGPGRLRARCSINTHCCSAPFTGTNRIEGPRYCLADRFRIGGIVSCCARLGLHIAGGISFTACPSAVSLRAQ